MGWREFALALLCSCAFLTHTSAQSVNQYSFSQVLGTYTPITGGTTFAAADDAVYSGTIGFNFVLGGVTYTTMNISTNGFISFGTTAPGTTNYVPISSTTAYAAAVAPFGRDMIGNTGSELRVETVGAAPNRTCVIQWKDWRRYDLGAVAGDALNFQVRLNETSNTISIAYGTCVATNTTARTSQLGLRGTSNADFNNRSTTTDWSNTSAGGTNTATVTSSNTIMPANGLTFTWAPPPPCTSVNGGSTTASSNPACAGTTFVLGLSGSTAGTGISYQWQSSPTGSNYTNISGATNSTYSATQTAPTWYQCIISCTPSGQSATSTPLLVTLDVPTNCYCIPPHTSGCASSDRIDRVVIDNLNNGVTGCTNTNGTGYTRYLTGLPVPGLLRGSTYPIAVTVGPGGTEHVRIFMDWNQDGDWLDAGEDTYIGSGNGVTINGNITVPNDALFGQTRMRVRVIYNTSVFTACSSQAFGEAEDYLVSVLAPPSCVSGGFSPANNNSSCPGTTTLSWPAVADATGYDVYFGTTNNPPLVSSNQASTSYDAGNLGVGTYFWRIEPRNAAGASTGCTTWTFSKADTQAPSISCPANINTTTAAGTCAATVNYTINSSDNCGTPTNSLQLGLPSGSSFSLGNTTVRWRTTDGVGLTAECFFTVSVSDNEAPTMSCPGNSTVGTSPASCTATISYAVSANDNCSGALTPVRTAGPASGTTQGPGTYTITHTATDGSNNNASCSFTITVADDDAPVITTCPPNIQLNTNQNCEAVLGNYTNQAVANDNCSAVTFTQIPAPGTTVPGFSTVTIRAIDATGNSSSCTFQTSAVDGTGPSITCPAEQFVNAGAVICTGSIPNFTSLAIATDNCGVPTVTQVPAPGSTIPFGQSNVTFTATDGPGFTATCTMQVTVVDVTAPAIVCPPNVTLSTGTDPNTCTAVATFICAVAPDNCYGSANPEQIDGLPSGSAFPLGTNVVAFQAVDQAGNRASCSFTITVLDDQAPYLACPQPITRNTDPGLCTSVTTWTPVATSDNCSTPTLVQTAGPSNGAAFPKGTTTVAFRSTDAAGNAANCSFTVTVNDNELPTIACPANVVRSNDVNQCGAVVAYTVAFNDNCPGATLTQTAGLASGSLFPVGTTTNAFIVRDASGNTATCSFTVTINDTQLPVITCPASIVRSNDLNQCGAVVTYANATATDNCPGVTVTRVSGPASGSFFPVGSTTIVFRATDASGNSTTCAFTVTVNDTQLPVLSCPGNLTFNTNPGVCGAMGMWNGPTATDNCPGVVVTFVSGMASGALFPVGNTTIVYRATDAAGNNTTCSWIVTVIDNEKPKITCPANIERNNDWGKCSAVVPFLGTGTWSDNCGVASVTNNGIGTYPVGSTIVTFTARDVNNNTQTCTISVTVKDYEPPVAKCPANVVVFNEPNPYCGTKVPYTVTATDNCPGVTVTVDEQPKNQDGYYSLGVTMIMARATDKAGNIHDCMFTITVNPAPEICDSLDNDCDGFVDEGEDWAQVACQFQDAGKAGDQFGTSVSMSKEYAAVGAKGDDTNGEDAGAVYILERNAGGAEQWNEVFKIHPAQVEAGDAFGSMVKLVGDWLLVGAPNDDDKGKDAGAAYLLHRNQGGANNWGIVKKLTAQDGDPADNFGISGTMTAAGNIVIGANLDDERGLNAGATYLFNQDQGGVGNWGQVRKIMPEILKPGDQFGISVAMEADMIVVGVSTADPKNLLNAGEAYLFAKDQNGVGKWGEVRKFTAADAAAMDNFGFSVAIGGNMIVIGSYLDDDRGSNSGSVYLFDRNYNNVNNSWGYAGKLTATDGTLNDQFGYAVAISGKNIVVGARMDGPKGHNSGSAYVFQRQTNGTYEQVRKLFDIMGGSAGAQLGSAVDIFEKTIIAGASKADIANKTDQGVAAVFTSACDNQFNGEEVLDREQPQTSNYFGVQAYPQPFSDLLNIEIMAEQAIDGQVTIWNSLGQQVAVVYNGLLDGPMKIQWNSAEFQPGAYYLRVETAERMEVKSLLLVR